MVKDLGRFPIPENMAAESIQELAQKVEAMLDAKQQLMTAMTDKDKTYYQNKCITLDNQIDRLVYKLYKLNEKEISIVEGN